MKRAVSDNADPVKTDGKLALRGMITIVAPLKRVGSRTSLQQCCPNTNIKT